METKLGDDAEEVQKVLSQNGVARSLAKEAIASPRTKAASPSSPWSMR